MALAEFPLLSFDQANPWMTGFQKGQDIAGTNLQQQLQALQLRYAPQMAQQELLKNQLANQASQAKLPFVAPQAAAELSETQARTPLEQAQAAMYRSDAGLHGAQADYLRQAMPYMLQQEKGSVFTDPILKRLYEMQLAKQGGINPDVLNNSGLFGSQQGSSQPTAINPVQSALPGLGSAVNPTTAPSMFSGDATQNWINFGSPYNPIQMAGLKAGAEEQGKTGVDVYNKAQTEASDSANIANQTKDFIDQFQTNYANSNLKGGVKGTLPATGLPSLPSRAIYGNLAAEQATDTASQNIAALVAKMVAGGRVTNYEMQYINGLKPNRAMDEGTAQLASDFLKQKSIRMKEQQDFLNAARSQNLDPQTAQVLWQKYNDQRPVYDFTNRSPNTNFQGSWKDFLSPQAVSAAKNGTSYVSIPQFSSRQQFKNWYASLPQDARMTVQQQIGGS